MEYNEQTPLDHADLSTYRTYPFVMVRVETLDTTEALLIQYSSTNKQFDFPAIPVIPDLAVELYRFAKLFLPGETCPLTEGVRFVRVFNDQYFSNSHWILK